jgi:hypothetical protein
MNKRNNYNLLILSFLLLTTYSAKAAQTASTSAAINIAKFTEGLLFGVLGAQYTDLD